MSLWDVNTNLASNTMCTTANLARRLSEVFVAESHKAENFKSISSTTNGLYMYISSFQCRYLNWTLWRANFHQGQLSVPNQVYVQKCRWLWIVLGMYCGGRNLNNMKKKKNYTYHHEQVRLQNGSLILVIYPIVICNAEKFQGKKKNSNFIQ